VIQPPPAPAAGPDYAAATQHVQNTGKATLAGLQQQFGISRQKAADLLSRMEQDGVVSPAHPTTGRRSVVKP
jgi:DNA segregation ATPase FtsK/SpoIIIE-like protein